MMASVIGFSLRTLSDDSIKAIVMWINCLLMAVVSIGCGLGAAWMPEVQAMWYCWCTLTGFASIACGIAFFASVMG